MSELDKININFNEKYKNVKTKEDLQNLKSEFFGKNGIITSQFKSLNSLSPDKKKDLASTLNQIKENLFKVNDFITYYHRHDFQFRKKS